MSGGKRANLERLLRSAWERQIRLQVRASMLKAKSSETPWYQSTLFWGAGSLGTGIVITVIAAMEKDFRWLLFAAALFFWFSLWEVVRSIRKVSRRRTTFATSCIAVTAGLVMLFGRLAPIRPYELSEGRREQFLGMLSKPQAEPRETLRIGCISWSEESCVAAGNFLMAFSEAGWQIQDRQVFHEEPGIPEEGVFIITHTSDENLEKMQALPPHLGIWQKMDSSAETIFRAFNAIGIVPGSSTDQSLPDRTIGVYFGPEPKQLRSVALPPRR
jgi:hypothetical protein